MHNAQQNVAKAEQRRLIRSRLRAVSAEQAAAWSGAIRSHLQSEPRWLNGARVVALYGPMPGEPDLMPLTPWLRDRGIQTAFFAIDGNQMDAYIVESKENLETGAFRVPEARRSEDRLVPPDKLSTALVPGLQFARKDGARLGRGAGHYDRYFSRSGQNLLRIGVAFDLQLVDQLPTEAHDAPMHALVTESGWRWLDQHESGIDSLP